MKIYKCNIYRPGGNDTALVTTMVKNNLLKKKINKKIMKTNPTVEQVGFIDKENKVLEMAGGEFCGNATRSAAYLFLNGKEGLLKIKISGAKNRLLAGINGNCEVWTQIPIYKDINKIKKSKFGYIVPMQGITHVVTEITIKSDIKKQALDILSSLNLINKPAAGVIFVSKTSGQLKIDPVVWVRNIKTLFYETACASGTAAVGLIESLIQNTVVTDLSIKQPSGSSAKVTVKIGKSSSPSVLIKGKVKLIKRDLSITAVDDNI